MSPDAATTQSLGELAAEILTDGRAALVIGYAPGEGKGFSPPLLVSRPEDAQRLGFDDRCFNNLAVYLSKRQVRDAGKTAIVVKGCDLRAVNVLLHENVLKREEVLLIGVRCRGMGDPQFHKCDVCECREPAGCDIVVGEPVQQPEVAADQQYKDADALDGQSLEQRWDHWQQQLNKCVRCYACRQVCPLCYCKRCVVEKTEPQWVETSAHLRGNIAWNVVRAFHLTGRCVGCGECERVCPMGIPLGAINQKMAKIVDEWFGFRSGLDPDQKTPFTTFSPDDTDDGIL